jgi:predicted TIM-barrel fold metal-dependent hydrolase
VPVQESPRADRTKPETGLGIYDVDVHHGWLNRDQYTPYLSEAARRRFEAYGVGSGLVSVANNGGVRGYRADVLIDGKVPEGGGVTAPTAELTRTQLLDDCGIVWALLTGSPVTAAGAGTDVDYATEVFRAFNDFSVDHWLSTDERFRLGLMVNTHDPEAAVNEIERLGDHPQVSAVMIQGGAQHPYGQRFYRPLHEAAAAYDLPLALHFNTEGHGVNVAQTGAGYPSYYSEIRVSRASSYKSAIASLVFEGTLERLPKLKFVALEAGFAWVPAFLWSMDHHWRVHQAELPHVPRPPSEYMLEQVRFASQPEDEPAPKDGLAKTLEWMRADRTLVYASDYPHWDWDDPAVTFETVPDELRERIFTRNAQEFFRN